MSRVLALSLLTACAGELSETPVTVPVMQQPGTAAIGLGVTNAVPGEVMGLAVRGLAPGAIAGIVVGAAQSPGFCPPAWAGRCLDVTGATVLGTATANAEGLAVFEVLVPAAAVNVGDALFFQAFWLDGPNTVASEVVPVTASAPLELSGLWVDDFMGFHDITSRRWINFGTFGIWWFDNDANVAVAKNGPDTFTPGSFSTFEWTTFQNEVYYCQSVFDAPTYQAALAAPASDASNPPAGGCGAFGFGWTRLIPAPM